ncbi:MAG: hypothetical protein HC824_11180, partial [Synechococcales cyanobacterium RM1_1_8]|nr:hypothetical protein [Synechococcales cyanobacterium RM1_1_8]
CRGCRWIGRSRPCSTDANVAVVEQAIIALGRLDSAFAHQALSALLFPGSALPDPLSQSRSLKLQRQAVRALGWSRFPEPIALLLEHLERALPFSSHPTTGQIAREIILVLGRMRPPQATPLAAQALADILPRVFAQGDLELKRSIALALGQLGQGESFDRLCPWLADPSPGLGFYLVAALKRLDLQGGRQRLEQRLSQALSPEFAQLPPSIVEPLDRNAWILGLEAAIAEWP